MVRSVSKSEITPDMCGLDICYWHCGEPKAPGQPLCAKHMSNEFKCKVTGCGKPPVKLCPRDGMFVCGHPVCPDHGCPVHSK